MMTSVITFLVIFTTVAIATAQNNLKPGIRVTFGSDNSTKGKTHSYYAPTTEEEAIETGWVLTRRPPGHLPQLKMYCFCDRTVCCLFDDTGYLAGMQLALSKEDFTENKFDWEERGFSSWFTRVNGKCKAFWTIQQYFVDDEFLSRSKKNRQASRNASRLLQAGAIWFAGNGGILRVSGQETEVARENLFTKQACIPQMGQHYYYNMSRDTQCTDEQMYPWGVMYTDGELTTSVFLTYGKMAIKDGERNWFERANGQIARLFINNGPECVYQLGDNPGIVSVHFFFVANPEDITCPA